MKKILILSLFLNILIISVVLGFTTKFETQNFGFRFKLPTTNYGQYIFELSNVVSSRYQYILPQMSIYSINSEYYKLRIQPFWTRTLFYALKNNDYSVIQMNPRASGNPQGSFTIFKGDPANRNLGYILGNIEENIAFYKCEDREWNNNWPTPYTCLGKQGNPEHCFGIQGAGIIIFDGILPAYSHFGNGRSSALTVCVRNKETN